MPELLRCMHMSTSPVREILAYLEVISLRYPYSLHLRSGQFVVLDSWEDLTTAWVVFYGNEYEVRKGDEVVVDLGANYGMFSLHASRLAPNSKIIAVEPFPSTFRRLQETMVSNKLDDRVKIMQVAVVGEAREVLIDDNPDLPSHARKISGSSGVKVEGLTLPMLFERFRLNRVDLLKVDVEGAEYELFSNLTSDDLKIVSRIGLEYHEGYNSESLFKYIESLGFRVFRHPKQGMSGVIEFERIK